MNKHGKIFFLKIFLIVLTTLMVIGTILIGFNYAMQTGRDIPNAISYSMGTVLLFCILTGIFSVIKSTRNNLVYIAFIIALLCLVGRANFNLQKAIELKSESPQQQYLHVDEQKNTGHSFYSKEYGFKCTIPNGYLPARSSKKSEIGMFVYPNYSDYEKMIIIEVGTPSMTDVLSTAKGLAEDWNGEVLPNPVNLDGVDALQIIVRNETTGLRPADAIVAMKDGKMFLVMAGLSSGQSCETEIKTILESWTWTKDDI